MDTNEISEQAGRKSQEWQETAREKAQQAKEAAQQWSEKAKTKARDTVAIADSYVHENAWTSVALVAVLAGFLGYLLGSRGED